MVDRSSCSVANVNERDFQTLRFRSFFPGVERGYSFHNSSNQRSLRGVSVLSRLYHRAVRCVGPGSCCQKIAVLIRQRLQHYTKVWQPSVSLRSIPTAAAWTDIPEIYDVYRLLWVCSCVESGGVSLFRLNNAVARDCAENPVVTSLAFAPIDSIIQ